MARGDLGTAVEWSYPQLLLVGLVGAVVLGALVAASTSGVAFGIYNPDWNGASGLQDAASEAGADPSVVLNTTAYTRATPNGTIAIVLSPDAAYTTAQAARVRSFVRSGGTLIVAEDFGPHGNALLADLGVASRVDGTPLRDERHYYRAPALPVATEVVQTNVTRGVDQLTLNHATVVRTAGGTNDSTVLVNSSSFAYLDVDRDGSLDDAERLARRPVVVRESVGRGTVYVVSDPSLFINAMVERPGNARFVENLMARHERALLDYSHQRGQPPLSVALLALRDSALLQLAVGLGLLGGVVLRGRLRWLLARMTDRLAAGIPDRLATTLGLARERPDGRALSMDEPDPDAVVAYLAREHPDWDRDRVRRVMRGVLGRDGGGGDDE